LAKKGINRGDIFESSFTFRAFTLHDKKQVEF